MAPGGVLECTPTPRFLPRRAERLTEQIQDLFAKCAWLGTVVLPTGTAMLQADGSFESVTPPQTLRLLIVQREHISCVHQAQRFVLDSTEHFQTGAVLLCSWLSSSRRPPEQVAVYRLLRNEGDKEVRGCSEYRCTAFLFWETNSGCRRVMTGGSRIRWLAGLYVACLRRECSACASDCRRLRPS